MGAAEVVKVCLEAFNRRDAEGMIVFQHPEVEFVPITAAMEGRVYTGTAGTREFITSLDLDWEVFEACPERFYERDDRGLALGTWNARGRTSGIELLDQRGGWFVVMRDGLVIRWRTFTSRDEALEAFGVTEAELDEYLVEP